MEKFGCILTKCFSFIPCVCYWMINQGVTLIEASCLPDVGTPLHNAAKERNRKAVRFLLENGAFLPPEMTDGRFNPPLHYCPGLHWAYKVRNKLQAEAQQIKKSEDEESTSDT
jgi:hypothetical protein